MGDPVNLGSRLEGLTKQYGLDMLVGEETKKIVTDVVFREVDMVRVKGKDTAVAIYEPLGMQDQVDKAKLDEVKLWNQCLKHYRAQEWDQAEVALLNLQRMNPHCELYRVYVEFIAEHRKHPPGPDWDGVRKFETK
jgi:adenylate cyclase